MGDEVESGEAQVAEGPDVAEVEGTTTTTTPPAPVDPRTLEVGSCFDDPTDEQGRQPATVESLDAGGPVVPRTCDEEHRYELYARVDLAGADAGWPGAEQIGEDADAACESEFSGYVGSEWSTTTFDYAVLAPDETRWAAGDRSVTCVLFDLGLEPLEASVAADA